MRRVRIPFFLLFGLSIIACNPTEITILENQFLEESQLIGSFGKEEFKNEISTVFGANASQALLFVQSGIEQYKITYSTKDLNGNTVLASGAVLIPTDFSTNLAIGSLHHGTLFNESDAPSYFKFETETTLATFMASTGIIVGMPDYIGYGESKNLAHPYEHYRGLAEPNADFIRAMVEMVKEKNLQWNDVLMLGGYSEGGYAAMATHKWIQESLGGELEVAVSVCGAGAYNKTASFDKLINEKGSSDLANNRSYIWVLNTYNEIYGLNKPMSYFFEEPYASLIESQGLNVEIDVSLNEILTEEFKQDFNTGAFPELSSAIADNDIYDWKPNAPVRLYHGTNDQYVPYINSQTALDAMKLNGTLDVELMTIEGGTHGSTIGDYFLGVLQSFTNYKGSTL